MRDATKTRKTATQPCDGSGTRNAIQVRDVHKAFGHFEAVAGVSFEVPEGSFTTLLGESGSGKSTTLRLLAGLETVDSGEISLRSVVVSSSSVFVPPERRKLGLVFQSYALWPHMTVSDQVGYPLKVQHDTAELKDKVNRALALVGLAGLGHRYPSELSGGQQQRVALARAIVYEPNVLLLDEPLSNLDATLRKYMRQELRQLHQRLGISTVYVTHDQMEALSLSDQVIVMSQGRIIERGTAREVYESPRTLKTARFVGAANVFNAKVDSQLADGNYQIILDSGVSFTYTPVAGQNLSRGQQVIVGVKPEDVTIDGPALPGGVQLRATIKSTSYYGSYVDVVAEVEGDEWQIRADKRAQHAAGSGAILTVRRETFSIFPDDTSTVPP